MSLKSFYASCIGLTLSLLCLGANANLIVNGSFEDNTVAAGGWQAFDSANVNGWDGDRIEIWNGLNGVLAQDGTKHAELNADPGNSGSTYSIFQAFETVIGQTYDVSFFYRARQNTTESFSFTVGNLAELINHNNTQSWTQFSGSFVATATTNTITFLTVNTGTYGNFLDNVVVTAKANVVESSPLVMLLIGLTGLVLIRKKNSRS